MSPLANVETDRSVDDFINAIPNERKKQDSKNHIPNLGSGIAANQARKANKMTAIHMSCDWD